MVTFQCPECGSTTVGPRDWKQWCANHEVIDIPGGKDRRLVQMEIENAHQVQVH
jgi:hypothetical protein